MEPTKKEEFEVDYLQHGDTVVLDIQAFNGKEEIIKWARKNISIELGKDQYIKGFDALLIGEQVKEHYQLEWNYHNPKTEQDELIHFEIHNKMYEDLLPKKMQKRIAKSEKKDSVKRIQDMEKEIQSLDEVIGHLEVKNLNLEKENEKLKRDIKENALVLEDKAKKVVAEKQEELRKHSEEKIAENKKYGPQRLLEDIMPIINNFEQAINWGSNSENGEVRNYVAGFKSLLAQLENALSDQHVVKIQPQEGDVYNPEYHQILETTEDSSMENDTIKKLTTPGYSLHDRLIMPARVVVVRNNNQDSPENNDEIN